MTEPTPPDSDLTDRLTATMAATGSPLSLAPHDPAELIDDEIAFADSRFGEDLMIRASRLDTLLSTHSINEVTEGLENLSAAYVIADQVESATWDGNDPVQGAHQGFTDKALTQGVVSLHSPNDALTVDVPVQSVTLDPPDRIAGSAIRAVESEIDRVTDTTFVERAEMTTPVGRQIADGTLTPPDAGAGPSSPFEPGDPFTSPSVDQTPDTSAPEPVMQPEAEPGHSPGM